MEWHNLTPEEREQKRQEFAKNCKVCNRCGAFFLGDMHIWSGNLKPGNALDLAGLVCNSANDDRCINPCKGAVGGQTFESRMKAIESKFEYLKQEGFVTEAPVYLEEMG